METAEEPGGLRAVVLLARANAKIRQTVILSYAVPVVYLHSLWDSSPESLKD